MAEKERKSEAPPTAARLRKEIDSGKTGDKVDHPDPAAAPLGTDDEAAGTDPEGLRRSAAYSAEISGPSSPKKKHRSVILIPITLTVVLVVAAFLVLSG